MAMIIGRPTWYEATTTAWRPTTNDLFYRDCGCAGKMHNDGGTAGPQYVDVIKMRNDGYAQCAKDHPVAKNLGKTVGGKPYTNCIDLVNKNVEDAKEQNKLVGKQSADESFASVVSSLTQEPAGSSSAASTAMPGGNSMNILIIGGGVVLLALGVWYFFFSSPATPATATISAPVTK